MSKGIASLLIITVKVRRVKVYEDDQDNNLSIAEYYKILEQVELYIIEIIKRK